MNKMTPTEQIALLKARVSYDPTSGDFVWIEPTKSAQVGGRADIGRRRGYAVIRIGRHVFLAHRAAWAITYGVWPGLIDHINRVRDDNRLANLREASRADNRQNVAKARSDSKTGVMGVHLIKSGPYAGKYRATIRVCGRRVSLGRYVRLEDAAAAYLEAKRRFHLAYTG